MPLHLRIESVPQGEAPLWVREQWVGLVLPLAQRRRSPLLFLTSGVLTGPKNLLSWLLALFTGRFVRQTGYKVEARLAVEVLAARSPEAAAWWRENVPHASKPGRYFVLQEAVGHVSENEA